MSLHAAWSGWPTLVCSLRLPVSINAYVAQVTDLHRHFIDDITIPSREGRGALRRVDDVFDCWFESGSMPVAQIHYPFENKDFFEASATWSHRQPVQKLPCKLLC